MKSLIGWLMVAAFCGAAGLVWADPVGQANKPNPQFLPPDPKQKVISGPTGKVKPGPKTNVLKNGEISQIPKLNEGTGMYYNFNSMESSHKLVTGKAGKDATLTAGGKSVPKMNGPQGGKNTQTTVKKVGKENLVNFDEGNPDKPIVTGQTYNGAATTSGK
jgi:hypothetical protein